MLRAIRILFWLVRRHHRKSIYFFLTMLTLGCRSFEGIKYDFMGRVDETREFQSQTFEDVCKIQDDELYTCTLGDCGLDMFSLWFSRSTGMGLVYSNDKSKMKVSATFSGEKLENIIELVARSCKCTYEVVGRTVYLGEPEEMSQTVYFNFVNGYNLEEVKSFLGTNGGNDRRAYTFENGLLIMMGNAEEIRNVDRVVQILNSNSPDNYKVCLYFVTESMKKGKDAYASDNSINLRFSDVLARYYNKMDFSLFVDTIVKYKRENNNNVRLQTYSFVVSDGKEFTLKDSDKRTVERHQISDNGTNSVSGYDTIDVGMEISVKLTKSRPSSFIMEMSLSNNNITSLNDNGTPNYKGSSVKLSCDVGNTVTPVCEFYEKSRKREIGMFSFLSEETESKTMIFAQVIRI